MFVFYCGLRGFHVYQNIWTPALDDSLEIELETANTIDPYAVGVKHVMGEMKFTVGHLPREISRIITKFVQHDGMVDVEVSSIRRQRSKITQGGLEIPIKLTAHHWNMELTERLESLLEPILAEWAKENIPLADYALSGPSTSACVVTKKQGPTTGVEKDSSSDEDHISVRQKRRRVVVCVSSDSDES